MQHKKALFSIPALICMASLAIAEDDADSTDASEAPDDMLELTAFQEGAVLSDDELSSHRARENIKVDQITINEQDNDGDVSENIAIGNTNGDNIINGDAFSHSSGFMSTVQNTGNNVLVQTSTIINVSMDTDTPTN